MRKSGMGYVSRCALCLFLLAGCEDGMLSGVPFGLPDAASDGPIDAPRTDATSGNGDAAALPCSASRPCSDGQACVGGVCQPDPCAGYTGCQGQTQCRARCVPTGDPCMGVTCQNHETCVGGS